MKKNRKRLIFILIMIVCLTAAIDKNSKVYPALIICMFTLANNYIDRERFFKNSNPARSKEWIDAFCEYIILASLIAFMGLAIYYKVWSPTS